MEQLYLNTNENTIPLNEVNFKGNTWIGVSALFNLNAVSQNELDIEKLFLIDHNEPTTFFLSTLITFISQEQNRLKVLDYLKQYIIENCNTLFMGSKEYSALDEASLQIERTKQDIENGKSFLSSDLAYLKIFNLAKNEAIDVIKMDLMDTNAIQLFKQDISQKNLTIKILYISNIGRRIIRCNGDIQRYLNNIISLSDSDTFILDSWLIANPTKTKLEQRLYPIDKLKENHKLNKEDHNIIRYQKTLVPTKWMSFYQNNSNSANKTSEEIQFNEASSSNQKAHI